MSGNTDPASTQMRMQERAELTHYKYKGGGESGKQERVFQSSVETRGDEAMPARMPAARESSEAQARHDETICSMEAAKNEHP